MDAITVLGSTFLATGFVAWTMCRAAARGDAMTDSCFESPASANDASGFDGGAVAAHRPIGRLMELLQAGLPALPLRMRSLPKDAEGKPIPHLLGLVATKFESSLGPDLVLTTLCKQERCWLCGDKLGQYAAFVGEPSTSVTRISRTPPAHHDCAKYAAMTGLMQPKDAKVTLVWVTRHHQLQTTANGLLFILGEPEQTFWFSGGRCATREEVQAALEKGAAPLYEIARRGGDAALSGLDLQLARARRQFPQDVVVIG